jgi:hypothetical protein
MRPAWQSLMQLIHGAVMLALASAVSVACGQRAPAVDDTGGAAIRAITGGTFEASGLVAVPGSNLMLFSDDGRPREVFAIAFGADGVQQGAAAPIRFGGDVTDAEGMTSDGGYIYMVGSQSKRTGYQGDGLVRFRFDPATRAVSGVESARGLKAWLAHNVAELRGTERRVGDAVLNIEGLAWDPDGQRLLLGLRAPVVDGKALVVPVKLVDATKPLTAANLRADGAALRVDLGGAGIRGIEHDAQAGRFVLITGASLNDENRDFELRAWDGRSDSTSALATYPRRLKPEGVADLVIGGRAMRVIVFDTGYLIVLPR